MSKSKNLTCRETQILQDIAIGLSTKLIAAKYGLSRRTVSNHRQHIIKKMKVANTIEAAVQFSRFVKLA